MTTPNTVEQTPTPTVNVGARLPADLVARVDAYAADASRPGLRLTRTDALKMLLEYALTPKPEVVR